MTTRKRIWHAPEGDPCEKCGQPAIRHPSSHARASRKRRDASRESRQAPRVILGIDGEGHDLPDGTHIYTYVCAVDETGRLVSEARNPRGLTHDECAEFLLSLPRNTLKFAFSFGYDLTMMLRDMPDVYKYVLLHPDTHTVVGKNGRTHRPYMRWARRGYDWFNGSFTVAGPFRDGKWRRSTHVWDCFRFFGTSFVSALTAWEVGRPEEREAIAAMKAQRGDFAVVDETAKERYCQSECRLLALMMRKLIQAHSDVGLELTRFDGAGTSGSLLLRKNGVHRYRADKGKKKRKTEHELYPPKLMTAIMGAFFGGRFENSVVGEVTEPVWGYDLASAYPYAQTTALPCMACGKWKHSAKKWRDGATAVVRVHVRADQPERLRAWGPLPCREADGSITYPFNFTGWVWRVELEAALAAGYRIDVLDAWVYSTPCDHEPFAYVPEMYRARCEWGKEGKGLTLKLGLNAGYGQTARSVGGGGPFTCWVWAGMTTAVTRAQILTAISCASHPSKILSIATDGIMSAERLRLPLPENTGTNDLKKPLGFWEEKEGPSPGAPSYPEGVMLVKPGLYYRLSPKTADDIRARGIGRREVFEQRDQLVAGFRAWDRRNFDYYVPLISRRFYGAKHCIRVLSSCEDCGSTWQGVAWAGCPECGQAGGSMTAVQLNAPDGRPAYGRWMAREVRIKFDPLPKRERRLERRGSYSRLRVRDLGGAESFGYDPFKGSTPLGEAAGETREFLLEQPDWDDPTRTLL